jgi:hypothetical protein
VSNGFDITLYEASKYLGSFLCPRCGYWHSTALERVKNYSLYGFCPVEMMPVQLNVTKRIPFDETPPQIKATALVCDWSGK